MGKKQRKTAQALIASIKKWEDIVSGEGLDRRSADCALCLTFPKCKKCPVAISGYVGCGGGSPYLAWAAHHANIHRRHKPDPLTIMRSGTRNDFCSDCVRLATDELRFLQMLLLEHAPFNECF